MTIAFSDHAGNSTEFHSTDFRRRAAATTSLCLSIANCDPDDAIVILGAALTDLRQQRDFGGNPHFREAVLQYRAERTRKGGLV
jgi:hypothetical protein